MKAWVRYHFRDMRATLMTINSIATVAFGIGVSVTVALLLAR